MYVSTSLVLAIVDELQREGITLSELCERAGVEPSDLRAPSLRVAIETYDRLVRAARALSASPDLGLRVGMAAPTGALNVVGYVVATCPTIREAFGQFLEYSALIKDGARWQMCEEGESARFVYEHPAVAEDNAQFDAEACLALVLKIGHQFVGEARPHLVCFRHPVPGHPGYAAGCARVFGCEVRFGAPDNELVFPRRYLDHRQAHHDERLRLLLQERAGELLLELGSGDGFLTQLRDLLRLDAGSGVPRASQLAERLGMTLRSLERQVRERGLSLAGLVDEARRDAACLALRRSAGSIKRVSYRLGFSEPSAFHRAFKRWTGMTPARYRAAAVATARARG